VIIKIELAQTHCVRSETQCLPLGALLPPRGSRSSTTFQTVDTVGSGPADA
jgi:hypothetical protein